MKKNWISWLALALSIAACIITWLRVEVYTTNDTFVGVMAGFMGACATIIVGFQIYNSIEYRNKLENISKMQSELAKELHEVRQERIKSEHVLRYGVNFTAALALSSKQPFTSFETYYKALIEALEANEPSYIEKSLHGLKCIVNIVRNNTKYSKCDIKNIEKLTIQSLEKHRSYSFIASRYEEIHSEIMKEIERIMDNEY